MEIDTTKYKYLTYEEFSQPLMSNFIDNIGFGFSHGAIGGFLYHLLKARSVRSALANAPRVGGFLAVYSLLADPPYRSVAAPCNSNKTQRFALQTALASGAAALMFSPRGLRVASCAALCPAALHCYAMASNICDTRDLAQLSKLYVFPLLRRF